LWLEIGLGWGGCTINCSIPAMPEAMKRGAGTVIGAFEDEDEYTPDDDADVDANECEDEYTPDDAEDAEDVDANEYTDD
jgi:hypothetical protein